LLRPQISAHCGNVAQQQQHLVAGLRAAAPPVELSEAPEGWLSSEATTALGLSSPAGKAPAGLLQEAVPAAVRSRLRPQLLQECTELDAAGARLLAQRDEGVVSGMTCLLQYRQVLQELLPEGYAESSHHHG
jgi:hypothetical protein